VPVPLNDEERSRRERQELVGVLRCFAGAGLKPTLLRNEERSRARGKDWRLCWGVTGAQAGMPVLLKTAATIPFCGLIFFRVADHLLLEGVL
jgi:hypothetical protein